MNLPESIQSHTAFVKELQETQEDRGMDDMLEGVHFTTKPFYTDRRGERCEVFCDGVEMATEYTSIPWSPFQEIRVFYNVWVDTPTMHEAKEILRAAKVKGDVEEDPYADPVRYHLHVKDALDVVAIWKVAKHRWLAVQEQQKQQ
jgi:hypothetical protein